MMAPRWRTAPVFCGSAAREVNSERYSAIGKLTDFSGGRTGIRYIAVR
jgi:hypothetical protein